MSCFHRHLEQSLWHECLMTTSLLSHMFHGIPFIPQQPQIQSDRKMQNADARCAKNIVDFKLRKRMKELNFQTQRSLNYVTSLETVWYRNVWFYCTIRSSRELLHEAARTRVHLHEIIAYRVKCLFLYTPKP